MKNTIPLLPFLVLLLLPPALPAQQSDSQIKPTTGDYVEHDLDVFIRDGAKIYSAPVHWQGKDWLAFGVVAGAAAVAYTFDEDVREAALPYKPKGVPFWDLAGNYYGRPETAVVIGGGLYLGGLLGGDDATRVTGRLVIESVTYSGIMTTLLKALFGRSRPYKNEGKAAFNWFESNNDNLAFPSGHTTVAFAISSVLAARVDNIYASIGLYGLALLTVTQRIVTDNHWLSDTVIGASIGTAVGLALVQFEGDRRVSVSAADVPYVGGLSPHAPLFGISVGM